MADLGPPDFSIECRDKVWPVHQAQICEASPVLEKICNSAMQELALRRIVHKEFDPAIVNRMICYIYQGKYEVPEHMHLNSCHLSGSNTNAGDRQVCQVSSNHILITHINVYGLADYYNISTLRKHAVEIFLTLMEAGAHGPGFANVVDAFYQERMPQNKELHIAMRLQTFKQRESLKYDFAFVESPIHLQDAKEIVIDLLREISEQHQHERSSLRIRVSAKDREVGVLEGREESHEE